MKRRNFLKTVVASLCCPILPKTIIGQDTPAVDIDDLDITTHRKLKAVWSYEAEQDLRSWISQLNL